MAIDLMKALGYHSNAPANHAQVGVGNAKHGSELNSPLHHPSRRTPET